MEEQIQHSFAYQCLSETQKEKADTILGFLNGENMKSMEDILLALTMEIRHFSVIKSQ